MLNRIQEFFQSLTGASREPEFADDDIRLTLAALCFQVAEADGVIHDAEIAKMRSLIQEHFQLEKEKIDKLMAAAKEAGKEAVDYYRFTSEIKRQLTAEQCRELVAILWDIIRSDGRESEMEDHVIWRISELLGVSDEECRAAFHKGIVDQAS